MMVLQLVTVTVYAVSMDALWKLWHLYLES